MTVEPILTTREILWPTIVEIYDTGFREEFNEALAAEIFRREAAHLLPGGQSQEGRFPAFSSLFTGQGLRDWPFAGIDALVQCIERIASLYLLGVFGEALSIERVNMWANVHRATHWHGPHSHFTGGRETLSGVYWVLAPEIPPDVETNGALVLADARGPYHPGRHRKIITPRPGFALLFPSWQQHYVAPIASDTVRVSIGFDVHCGRIIP